MHTPSAPPHGRRGVVSAPAEVDPTASPCGPSLDLRRLLPLGCVARGNQFPVRVGRSRAGGNAMAPAGAVSVPCLREDVLLLHGQDSVALVPMQTLRLQFDLNWFQVVIPLGTRVKSSIVTRQSG